MSNVEEFSFMSIYAEVKIVLKDGRKFGTWDITQGSIRDTVLEVMKKCVPSETPYGSVAVQGGSTLLQEMVDVFRNTVDFKFEASVVVEFGVWETLNITESTYIDFKNDLEAGITGLWTVEQDEYSTAFLPAWVEDALGIDFEDEPDEEVFLSYCDSFLNGKIFFGVTVDEIESITLELS